MEKKFLGGSGFAHFDRWDVEQLYKIDHQTLNRKSQVMDVTQRTATKSKQDLQKNCSVPLIFVKKLHSHKGTMHMCMYILFCMYCRSSTIAYRYRLGLAISVMAGHFKHVRNKSKEMLGHCKHL